MYGKVVDANEGTDAESPDYLVELRMTPREATLLAMIIQNSGGSTNGLVERLEGLADEAERMIADDRW